MAAERKGRLDVVSNAADLKAHIDANGALPLYEGLSEVFRGDSFDEIDLIRRIEVNVLAAQKADPEHAMEIAEEGVLMKIAAYRAIANKAGLDDPNREALYYLKQANEYMVLMKYVDSAYRQHAQREADNAYRVQASLARREGDTSGLRSKFTGDLSDALKSEKVSDDLFSQLEVQIASLQGALAIEPEMPTAVAQMSEVASEVTGTARDISAAKAEGQAALYAAYRQASEGLPLGELAKQQHQYLRNMYELTGNDINKFDAVKHHEGDWKASTVQEYMQAYLEYVETMYTLEKEHDMPELRQHRIAALENLKVFAKYAAEHLPSVGKADADLSGRNLAVAIMDLPQHNKLDSIRGLLGRPGYEHPPLSKWAKAWQSIKSFFGAKPAQSTYEALAKPEGAMPAQEASAKDEAVVHYEEGKPMPTGFEESAAHEPAAEAPKHDGDAPEQDEEGPSVAPRT